MNIKNALNRLETSYSNGNIYVTFRCALSRKYDLIRLVMDVVSRGYMIHSLHIDYREAYAILNKECTPEQFAVEGAKISELWAAF